MENVFVDHNLPTMQQSPICALVSLAAFKVLLIFIGDLIQVYLQSDEQLNPERRLTRKQEYMSFFSITKENFLKLLWLLYGLIHIIDYCFTTIHRHIRKKLSFLPFRAYPYVYSVEEYDVFGLFAVYVDDTLRTGYESFIYLPSQKSLHFESKQNMEQSHFLWHRYFKIRSRYG